MAYIIPNATETGSGKKYANINQAEPDSVDIEALGNRANWVRKGLDVSIAGEYVTVSAGTVVINNKPYYTTGMASQQIDRAIVGARTDLLVARLAGAVVTVTLLEGVDTATNPIFPKSKSVLLNQNDFLALSNYDPDNDVLIAAIYVTASETDANNIVDKRIISRAPIVRYSGTTASPTLSTDLDEIGDVVVASNDIVYIRTNSAWDAIASRSYANTAGLPIGSVFAWAGPVGVSPGVSYLECDGSTQNAGDYPALAAVLGSTYGTAAAGYFVLPKLDDDRTVIGSVSGHGTSGGSNDVVLTESNIPQHSHTVTIPAHGNNGVVTHDNGTATLGTTPQTGGNHQHTTQTHTHDGALIYRQPSEHNNHHVGQADHSTTSNIYFHVDAINVNESDGTNPFTAPESDSIESQGITRFRQGSNPITNAHGGHSHAVTVPAHTGLVHTGVTVGNFGQATPTAIDRPKYLKMRWFIRAK